MKTLGLGLRTSPMRWFFLPLVVLDLAILLLRTRYWIGIWPETGAAAQVPAFFISILAAAAGAWMSGTTARNNMEEQLAAAAIPRIKPEGNRLGITAGFFLAAYLVGQTVAFALTARSFPPGVGLWVGYLLMGVVLILLALSWGWILGKFFNSVYAALVAVLSWLIFLFYLSRNEGLSVTSGPPWMSVDLVAVGARLGAVLLLCLGVLWLRPPTSPDRRRFKALAPTAATLVVAMGVIGATSVVEHRSPPSNALCHKGRIVMCLWPEHQIYLPLVSRVDDRVKGLPAAFVLPSRLNEYGMNNEFTSEDGVVTDDGSYGFDISEGSKWSVALGVSDAIVGNTIRKCDVSRMIKDRETTSEAVARWLEGYLAGGGVRDYSTSGVPELTEQAWVLAAKIASKPEPEQLAWAVARINEVRARYCA